MEGFSVDYSQVISEIELVIGLLKEKGVEENIDANLIFEKLERKTKEKNRVAEVVRELIAEKAAPDVEVIDIDDDQDCTNEVLVDLKNGNSSRYNHDGKVANKAEEIFERERRFKRSGDTIDSVTDDEKRFREDDIFELLEDSFPIEEVQAIEACVAASTRGSVEIGNVKESVNKGAQNYSLFLEELSSSQGGYFELASEKKGENTPVESTCSNHSQPDQGSVAFLFNNIIPGSEPFLGLDDSEHIRALTTDSPRKLQVKSGEDPNNQPTSGSSVIIKNDTQVQSGDPELEKVLASLLPTNGPRQVIHPHEDDALNSSVIDHTAVVLSHHRQGKAAIPTKNPSLPKEAASQCAGNVTVLHNHNGSNHPIPSCSKTKYEENQPSCSFNSFPLAQRFEEVKRVYEWPIASTSEASAQKVLQVDLVESSLKNEDAANVARIAPKLQEVGGTTSNVEANASEVDKSELYEEQLEYLIAVLPDADPAFLEGLVRDCEGNDEKLKNFVVNALENNGGKPIYPTRDESQQKKEEEDLIKRFTENFSVEDFLQVFPDPVAHFESETREIEDYREHSMAYLRCKFRHLYISNIRSALKKRNYNLSLTALDLGKFSGVKRKSKRSSGDCKWPSKQSIAFLQEVAYLENKEKIVEFLEEKKAKRQRVFEEAKANNALSTCGCCFDDEFLFEDMSSCSEGHLFCKDCIKRGAEVIIGDGNSHFPCMNAECKEEFSLATLQGILTPSVFGKLVQRLQMEEINAAGIEGLETCPSCPYSTIPAPGDKIFKCLNPECLRETCRKCKEQSHIPLRCEEVERNSQVKARTYIEDKMTEALVRTCWKCSKKFIKESGCNKMTCTCGATMCYLCRQPVKDYKHFNPEAHRKSDLCPLYSNDGELDFNAVKAVAEKAKEEVLQQNPNIELIHDPTLKLPEVPPNPPPRPGVHHGDPAWDMMNLIPLGMEMIQQHRFHHVHPQPQQVRRRVVHVYPYQPAMAQIDVMPVYFDNQHPRHVEANAHVAYPPPPPRNHVPYRRH